MKKIAIISSLAILLSYGLQAREIMNTNSGSGHRYAGQGGGDHILAGCTPSTAKTELDINNVRTLIFINGDMWWDLVGTATYEIPKGSGKHSLFAGALWIGGLDHSSKALKVSAQLYRQSGSDFWPGPIDTTNTSVTPDVCIKFDKHFKVTREQVLDFAVNSKSTGYTVPDVIKNWPGNGDDPVSGAGGNYSHFLAPYYDTNGDGIYNYLDGDFPGYYDAKYTPNSDPCSNEILLGDQTLWWVFNDVGNIHGESHSATPIGIEVHAQAFAFATNDEINNMTFYRYKIINRSSSQLDSTYFGQFVDPDLGNYLDDYVGCDVKRGFGYCYNGEDIDPGATGYGANPPAIGIDFFQGPLADIGDHKDNDRDSCVDCTKYTNRKGVTVSIPDTGTYVDIAFNTDKGRIDTVVVSGREQIIMSKFMWFNNDATVTGNPNVATDYYGYLKGIWKDGKYMTYGGNGHGGGQFATSDSCDFMFPGNPTSDPYGWGNQYGGNSISDIGVAWDERKAGNLPYDRRFVQSAGPFTLLPGAVNFVTTGAVWARTSGGGPLASLQLVRNADDFAQALFNNCFRVINGPDAPDVSIRELDKEIILSLNNDNPLRNNHKEIYSEKDPNTTPASAYKFEGYQIWQVKNDQVSTTDISNPEFNYGPDPDKARLVGEFDIKNGVAQIINYYLDAQTAIVNGYALVTGLDNGLQHTLKINTDLFATGDPTLVNHKTYYYMALAYAYNPDEVPVSNPTNRNRPYLTGRQNIHVYTAIPHISAPEVGGLLFNSSYGDGPEITRLEGQGNGYLTGFGRLAMDLKDAAAYNELFTAPFRIGNATYQKSRGPVDIRIYDPMAVSGGSFDLKEIILNDTVSDATVLARDTISYDRIISHYKDSIVTRTYTNVITKTDTDTIVRTDTINGVAHTYTYYNIVIDTISDSIAINTSYTNHYVVADNKWVLTNLSTGQKDTSVKTIFAPYDQLFPNYGFFINMAQTLQPGQDPVTASVRAGFIEATQTFDNLRHPWLSGVPDIDGTNYDWIASNDPNYIYNEFVDTTGKKTLDAPLLWQKLLGGTWAPYKFTRDNTPTNNSPAYFQAGTYKNVTIHESNMTSVDIVITDDRSKWSRAAVIEENAKSQGIGHASFGLLRKSTSLDINGDTIIGSTGFSYFPGYAVNVETGERLNIAFGEDSYLSPANGFPGETGADMKWNPTATFTGAQSPSGTVYDILGGKHVIYVFGHTFDASGNTIMPAYDSCNYLASQLTNSFIARTTWTNCIWVGYTMLAQGEQLDLSNHVKIRIRVTKPYKSYIPPNAVDSLPHYQFNTDGMRPTVNDGTVAKSALDLINVVPNPYYAYSQYEKNVIDYRVKIVNLPAVCTISIYTPSGTLVRTINRAVSSDNTSGDISTNLNLETSVDWDLKNSKGIPVSSGIYIIHVDAPGVGEKTIKFFGILRPIDLDTF